MRIVFKLKIPTYVVHTFSSPSFIISEMRVKLVWGLLGLLPCLVLSQQLPPKNFADKNERLRSEKQAPCRACSTLVKSFREGKIYIVALEKCHRLI